jgi:predicted ester cyclase
MSFLPGFDEKWRDAQDFITGITSEIWEERRFERQRIYYAEDVVLRMAQGSVLGHGALVADTQGLLAEFPDLQVLSEDALWMQSGYKSCFAAQRLFCHGTHAGGAFGPATGREIGYRVLTESWCRANQVAEEWRVGDTAAITRQLGLSTEDWARAMLARQAQIRVVPEASQDSGTLRYDGKGNDNDWGHTLGDMLTRIMAAEVSIIARHYDRAAELAYPGGETVSGRRAAEHFWTSLRAAFPSARFEVKHVLGMEDHPEPPRAAVRWRLIGRHDGWGMFGAPSGAEVNILGMTQAEFGPRGLRREWTLVDEAAIWRQILRTTGAYETASA